MTSVTFNIEGTASGTVPPGEQGPAGPAGPTGPTGPAGPAGVSPVIDVNALATELAPLVAAILAATPGACDAGSIATSAHHHRNGVRVSGKSLINSAGKVVQLRGVNLMGLEYTAIQGWSVGDPWGGIQPNWAQLAKFNPNVVRIPLNAASYLGLTVYELTGTGAATTWGKAIKADPGGNYVATVDAAIASARSIGCRVILDLHWTAPKLTLGGVTNYVAPMGQSAFADVDMGLPFWQAIAAKYGSSQDILFELFNEPFLDANGGTLSAGSADLALLNGGTSSLFINNTQGGANYQVNATWNIAGYQQIVNAIRKAGATNVIIVNGNQWTQQLKDFKTYLPTDPLNQVAFGWHPYPAGTGPLYKDGDVYPKCGADNAWAAPSPTNSSFMEAVLAAGYPVIATESGGSYGPQCTAGEPYVDYMTKLADSTGMSLLSWVYTNPQPAGSNGSNSLLVASTLVPTPGQGVAFLDWTQAHVA